jgi:predicted  nucleic acid-binding Zn-ribbon protein
MAWACDRCDTIHTQNPSECRNCGHHIFQPVSDERLRQQGRGAQSYEPAEINSNQKIGTTSESQYTKSPDVAVDGSIENDLQLEDPIEGTSSSSSLQSIYYSIRGTVRAPFALLWEYIIPILAFLTVIGVGIYFVLSL